jgi:hypothetical protein
MSWWQIFALITAAAGLGLMLLHLIMWAAALCACHDRDAGRRHGKGPGWPGGGPGPAGSNPPA